MGLSRRAAQDIDWVCPGMRSARPPWMWDNPLDTEAFREAQAAVRRGLWVLPLAGKQPVTQEGFAPRWSRDSTNDLQTVRGWFSFPKVTGWGVDLKRSKLLVVDVDPRNLALADGQDALGHLESLIGDVATYVVRTGGADGGVHVYFTNTAGLPTCHPFGPGIDVKASGGFVVGAGSRHPDTGDLYRVVRSAEVAEPPSALVVAIRTHANRTATRTQHPTGTTDSSSSQRKGQHRSAPPRPRRGYDDRDLRSLRLDESVGGQVPRHLVEALQEGEKGERSEALWSLYLSMLNRGSSVGEVFDFVVETPAAQGHFGERGGDIDRALLNDIAYAFEKVSADPPKPMKKRDPKLEAFLARYEQAWRRTHSTMDKRDTVIQVFIRLARMHGSCSVSRSVRQLADDAACSSATVSRHCKALLQGGWLQIEQGHTHLLSRTYRLILPSSCKVSSPTTKASQSSEDAANDTDDVHLWNTVAPLSGDVDLGHDAFRSGALHGPILDIIERLHAAPDSELGIAELTDVLGVTPRTVRNRVARLEELGVVQRVQVGRRVNVRLIAGWDSIERLNAVAINCGTAGTRANQRRQYATHQHEQRQARRLWRRHHAKATTDPDSSSLSTAGEAISDDGQTVDIATGELLAEPEQLTPASGPTANRPSEPTKPRFRRGLSSWGSRIKALDDHYRRGVPIVSND